MFNDGYKDAENYWPPYKSTYNLSASYPDAELEDAIYKEEMELGRRNYGSLVKKTAFETWSIDSGYQTTSLETYPRRVLGIGTNSGLNLILQMRQVDLGDECWSQVEGFKVVLHNPGEIPRLSRKFFRVPLSKEIELNVKPVMITTSEGLASYSPERRQCFFSNEGDLKFFRIYTQYHCELECLATYTLSKNQSH